MVKLVSESEKEDGVRLQLNEDANQNRTELEKVSKAAAIVDESQSGKFPRIVASGRGRFAEQILQVAWSNDIKVREDADLAEVLTAIDLDSEIPIEAFAAVAEILSYVYRANAGLIPLEEDEKPITWLTQTFRNVLIIFI